MGGRHLAHGAGEGGGDGAPGTAPGVGGTAPGAPTGGVTALPRRAELRADRGRRRAARRAPRRRGAAPFGGVVVAVLLVVLVGLSVLVGPRLLRSVSSGGATTSAAGSAGASTTGDGVVGAASDAGAPSAVREVQALLDARAAALVARDRTAWLAAVGSDDAVTAPARTALDAFRTRTAAVFDRLAPVPLGTWRWTVTGGGPALSDQRAQQLPARSWVVRTTLVWSLDGAGDDPVRRQQDLTAVPSGSGWALVDDADGETVPDLWDLGDVGVVTTERAVVLGTADADALERTAEVTAPAAEGVDAVWGTDWPRRTVVEVPADQAQMARLLGRDDDAGLDQIAAVTTGELVGGGAGATRGDHVVVNPTGFGRLAPVGQRVVLTHELTHVATRSGAVRAVPLWLSEGFADWVGYQGTGLSRQAVATDLLRQVRADGPPASLPTAADFDPTRTADIGPAYSGAWLAVDALARRYGDAAVVDLYRAASRDPLPQAPAATGGATDAVAAGGTADAALDAALASTVGTDRAGVLALWRAELVELAR